MRPSGRKASDQGCSRPLATVVTSTFVSPLGGTCGASWQAPVPAAASSTTSNPRDVMSEVLIPAIPFDSARGGTRDDVAAGLRVEFEVDQLAVARLLEQVTEGLEAVVALVEPRFAPLQRLLDHRAPDLLLRVALGEEVLGRLHHELDALLAAVVGPGRRLGRRLRDLLLARALRPALPAHQVVVVDELVAAAD